MQGAILSFRSPLVSVSVREFHIMSPLHSRKVPLVKCSPKPKIQLRRNPFPERAAGSSLSLPHRSPSPLPVSSCTASHSVNLPCGECLETMHQSLHKERGSRSPPLRPGSGGIGWRAPGFSDTGQTLGPLCGCQEQRALMIAHCHWSRARDTQAQEDLYKPQCTDRGRGQKKEK